MFVSRFCAFDVDLELSLGSDLHKNGGPRIDPTGCMYIHIHIYIYAVELKTGPRFGVL